MINRLVLIQCLVVSALLAILVPNAWSQTYDGLKLESWTANDAKFSLIRRQYAALGVSQAEAELKRVFLAVSRSEVLSDEQLFRSMTICSVYRRRTGYDSVGVIMPQVGFKKTMSAGREHRKPDSYEFTRARFVFLTRFDSAYRGYLEVGKRLLKQGPSDYDVLLSVLRILEPQAHNSDRQLGKDIIQLLDREHAGSDMTRDYLVGCFYYLAWFKSRSMQEKKHAIERLQIVRNESESMAERFRASEILKWIEEGSWLGIKPKGNSAG